MAADWDPFGIDEQPTGGAVASVANSAAHAVGGRLARAELDGLADEIYKQTVSQRPWQKTADPSTDLTWYQPSSSFENWNHKDVKVELGQGIAYVTLNRPNDNNLLSASVLAGLCDAVFALHSRKDLRCVVFSGEGKLFCGGADPQLSGTFVQNKQPNKVERVLSQLKERAIKAGALKGEDDSTGLGRLLQAKVWFAMATLPQFSITLVNGSAIGDGAGCLACVDMVIAVQSAYFSFPEVRDGRIQCILTPYIVAKVGPGFAKYMLGSGRNLTAEDLRQAGLISEVVESVEEGHQKIAKICEVLTECGPRSVEAAKQLVVGVGGQPITEGVMFFTAALLAMVTVSDEARDGMICVQARKDKPWQEKPITPLK